MPVEGKTSHLFKHFLQGRLARWVKDEERWKPTRISGILSGTLPEYPPGGKLIVLTNEEKAGVINSP